MVKLALCVITEGDEKLSGLSKLLNSVDGVFDSVHITANGKNTKETEALCKKFGIDYSYLKWGDDFSAQRNYNFSRVPEDTDYIIWADSDDVIVNAKRLRDVAQIAKDSGHDVVFMDYWYGASFNGEPSLETFVEPELTQSRERLIRPGSVVWKKRIHETPAPVDPARFVYSRVTYSDEWPVVWLHLGAPRSMIANLQTQDQLRADPRNARNQRLLELELEDERKSGEADPRTLLYLMKIYVEYAKDPVYAEKCFDMGKEYLEKSGWDQERSVCYRLMSVCAGEQGQHQRAKELLHSAIEEYPHDALLYLYLARTYYNLKNYRAMKHWMRIGLSLDISEQSADMNNLLELKILGPQLLVLYYLHGEKDIRKAHEYARTLAIVDPTEQNKENELYLYNQKELDIACEHLHKLAGYYEEIGREDLIPTLIDNAVDQIKMLPFAVGLRNKYVEPRTWGENEICYFATFGGPHFEKWDASSVEKGIGGSETAVIELSKEWAKRGYLVTVYGDPARAGIDEYGINWQPYYMFNARDNFNIFIQWRNDSLAGRIACKKFLVDLHDMYMENSFDEAKDSVDTFMVKSKYHRNLSSYPDDKYAVISNGI